MATKIFTLHSLEFMKRIKDYGAGAICNGLANAIIGLIK